MYWGEYPISFAAYLQQEEIFKMLINHGADICVKDSNGNNVLHMIHNNKVSYYYFVEKCPTLF